MVDFLRVEILILTCSLKLMQMVLIVSCSIGLIVSLIFSLKSNGLSIVINVCIIVKVMCAYA